MHPADRLQIEQVLGRIGSLVEPDVRDHLPMTIVNRQ
jgi:hypothetical protein